MSFCLIAPKKSSLVYALLAIACLASQSVTAADAPADSLYARMGGATVVAAVSNDLIDRTVGDAQLKRSFDKVDIPRLKNLLTEQLCFLAGGPCTYSGDSMVEVHAGLNIRQDEFYGMVEVLREVLSKQGVATRERNELLALLAPMKRDVVTR